MRAQRTEYDGIYKLGNYIAVRSNFGYGIEWAVHHCSPHDYFSSNDAWNDTFPTLKDAKAYVADKSDS